MNTLCKTIMAALLPLMVYAQPQTTKALSLQDATLQSIEASKREKETAGSNTQDAPAIPSAEQAKATTNQPGVANQTESSTSTALLTPASLKLPPQFAEGYPIRIAIMDFVSGADLMLGSQKLSPNIQPLAKLLYAGKNNTFSIPLGAMTLGIELQKLNPQLFMVMPGKNGGGFEDLAAVQEAVLKQGVSHLAFCVISDIHHKEDPNSGVHYGGITVSSTIYSLDLNIVIYDLSRGQSVFAETYTAEYAEERPFNKDYINLNLFEALLKNVCTNAARGIVGIAEDAERPIGIKPPISPK